MAAGRAEPPRRVGAAGSVPTGDGPVRRPPALRLRVARLVLAVVLVPAWLLVFAGPASACSCAAAGEPAFDFTARAVEDLGYTGDDGSSDVEHRWRLEVVDGRRGVATGDEVRLSMTVGEQRRGDSVMVSSCGLDDNLVVGSSYEIRTNGFDHMSACGSSVQGTRTAPLDRAHDEGGGGSGPRLVAALGAVALLGLGGRLAVRRRRTDSREDLHKRG